MINPTVAYQRNLQWLRARNVKAESDLQTIVYQKNWVLNPQGAAGDTVSWSFTLPQGTTMVLGMQAAAIPFGQPVNPFLRGLERFAITINWTNRNTGLVVPDGQNGGIAQAVFGWFGDKWPAVELCAEANDIIGGTVQNATPDTLIGSLALHCRVWKYSV